jgi:hypothetical protein
MNNQVHFQGTAAAPESQNGQRPEHQELTGPS